MTMTFDTAAIILGVTVLLGSAAVVLGSAIAYERKRHADLQRLLDGFLAVLSERGRQAREQSAAGG